MQRLDELKQRKQSLMEKRCVRAMGRRGRNVACNGWTVCVRAHVRACVRGYGAAAGCGRVQTCAGGRRWSGPQRYHPVYAVRCSTAYRCRAMGACSRQISHVTAFERSAMLESYDAVVQALHSVRPRARPL